LEFKVEWRSYSRCHILGNLKIDKPNLKKLENQQTLKKLEKQINKRKLEDKLI
jgi:hypothetical protein